MRFSPIDGRKRPCKDVLDRFKRLNNGLWIRTYPARFHKVSAGDFDGVLIALVLWVRW